MTSKQEVGVFIGKFMQELTKEDVNALWGLTIRQWLKAIVTSEKEEVIKNENTFLTALS